MALKPSVVCRWTVVSAGFFVGTGRAEEPVTNLPPIVVEASRTHRTADAMPGNVTVVTGEEIARAGHLTVAEALQKQAGVFVRVLSDNPANAQISMRGFGANSFGRVLVLVDGERLNNPDMSSPNLLRVPVEAVERIEVLHGSQTVLYGDVAEAGVINIITTGASGAPRTTVSAAAGSHGTFSAHLRRTGALAEGLNYFADAGWMRSDGYRDNSDYKTWNVGAGLEQRWDEARYVSFSAFYHKSEYGLPGALTWAQYKSDPKRAATPRDEAEYEMWGVKLGAGVRAGADGRLEADFTASRREAGSRWYGVGWASEADNKVDAFSFTPRYTLERPVAGFDNRLTVGADVRLDRYSSETSGWDFDRTSAGAYAQDEFFITEELSLTLGGRAERFHNRVESPAGTRSFHDTEGAAEAALLWRPVEGMKVFARAARYYRAPFVDEVVSFTGVPNTGLDPESGLLLEAGVAWTFAREWTLAAAVYQMDSKDEIYYHTDSMGVGQNRNAPDDTRRTGFEASLGWSREAVGAASLKYEYVRPEFTEGEYDGRDFPMVPRQMVSFYGEVYAAPGLALLGGVRYVGGQYLDSDFANAQPKLKGYGLLDLAVRYEPGFLKGVRLLAGVDNVLDKEYANYGGYSSWSGGYYYPAAARTWKVCASYSF